MPPSLFIDKEVTKWNQRTRQQAVTLIMIIVVIMIMTTATLGVINNDKKSNEVILQDLRLEYINY